MCPDGQTQQEGTFSTSSHTLRVAMKKAGSKKALILVSWTKWWAGLGRDWRTILEFGANSLSPNVIIFKIRIKNI